MADFGSHNKTATWEEWIDQVVMMLEINGYNPNFCDIGREGGAGIAYDNGYAVDDFFYENYDADE